MDLKKEMDGLQYWLSMLASYRHKTKVNTIEKILSDTQKTPPIGIIFSVAIREMTPGFLRFQRELQDLLSRSQNRGEDLQIQRQKFGFYIEWYKTWYSEHQKEVALFDNINPYDLIYDIIIQTEKEFLQYEAIEGKHKRYDRKLRDTLEKAIEGPDLYNSKITQLIDEGLIDPVTHTWKDNKSGWMTGLASKIKEWKSLTGKLSDEEIQAIAKNTFHVEISISTIQKAKPFNK